MNRKRYKKNGSYSAAWAKEAAGRCGKSPNLIDRQTAIDEAGTIMMSTIDDGSSLKPRTSAVAAIASSIDKMRPANSDLR
ncbi:hypothetical protein G6M50_11075 [Agrobacterium rhizogenes]|nr:hypothetical protein [Rhizobium rhizogenes]NTJ78324.1 hypothetical protein [Rhizobium rhizogenes]